jgi:aspartate aminotransferase
MNTVSTKAANLIGSEIIRLGNEINQRIREGHRIFNLTIGDFTPSLFPIPEALRTAIIDAYMASETNYPPADGVPELKGAVQAFLHSRQGLQVASDELMIAGGGRPLIYAIYQTLVDPGDVVVYPTPSWNNNHYCYLSDARGVEIATTPENSFMPTAAEIAPHLADATLLALCSPLNPTGTTFTRDALAEICDLVLAENARRGSTRKPLYVLYDQIYWMLRADGVEHVDPVTLRPEMKQYTVYVDGISKSLAATGVRVGWSVGPAHVITRMKAILGHIGAWAPRAEQMATARFLQDTDAVNAFIDEISTRLQQRFDALYTMCASLASKGYPVRAIKPEGAIYVSVQFALRGKRRANGSVIETPNDITAFLLEEAKVAIVPFTAFGCDTGTDWFRLSVGTLNLADMQELEAALDNALATLQ